MFPNITNKTSVNIFAAGKPITNKSNASTNCDYSQLSEGNPKQVIQYLNSQIVGRSLMIDTVFGRKLKLYCDYTASGQQLRFIADLLLKIEDYYANTHTETSATGAYMNSLLNQAEEEILRTMKASPQNYFVAGAGSGSTFGIEMAQKYLGTYLLSATRQQLLKVFDDGRTWEDVKNQLRAKNQLPLVIISHYEHHSNEVTWRQQLCDVTVCPATDDGHIDIEQLEELLTSNDAEHRRLIGSFSAGSNVTGMKTDIFTVASLLKRYNALAFFDFAAVGPYVAIDLSRKTQDGRCLIDGVYVSPHKFLGGPGSCGILVFNRQLYDTQLEPSHGGGGTVDFVNRSSQSFTDEPSHREKSGTPGILQIIRAALAFHLKAVLQPIIDEREHALVTKFLHATALIKNMRVLGSLKPKDRVCIASFLVMQNDGPKGTRFLHHNLVVKLLNDIFGIQGRAGCSCAGPYGHYLFNVDDEMSALYRFWVDKHVDQHDDLQLMGFKLGWSRVNLHYTFSHYEMDYLLFAINFICENGYRFLPAYCFDPVSGQWSHKNVVAGNMPNHHLPPKFTIDSLMHDERNYAKNSSDAHRRTLFEKQKNDAMGILAHLPKSRGYDAMEEMPFCFFYAEKGNILNRELVKQKGAIFANFYGKKDGDVKNDGKLSRSDTGNH